MTSLKKWFFGVVAAQLVFLMVWAGKHELQLHVAPTVLLETVPVDPRDLLRGDFVILRYKISTVAAPASLSLQGAAPEHLRGRSVYVRLVRRGGFHEAEGVSLDRFDPRWDAEGKEEASVIRGTVDSSWSGQLGVKYGIEQYFVPEGRGQNISGRLVVEASVAERDGSAQIKRVLLNGRPFP